MTTKSTPKLPTELRVGDVVKLYGRVCQVVSFDARGRAVAKTNDGRVYVRDTYFVEHKNLWRSRWFAPANYGVAL
jgi:hypothetical protein